MRPIIGPAADQREWFRVVRDTHERRIRVRTMNLDQRTLSDITARFVDGEVSIDTRRNPHRIVTMRLHDQNSTISWEPETVTGVPRYGSRMVRVDVLVKVPGLGRWTSTPVFVGPVVDFDRQGPDVTITAHSKERLAGGNFPTSRTYRRKRPVTDVIKDIMSEAGERKLGQVPDLRATLPEDLTVGRGDVMWDVVDGLARDIGRRAVYNARGQLLLLRQPARPVMTVRSADLAAPVEVDRRTDDPPNRWIVRGAKPKGAKKRVRADIHLPRRHPLSAWELGRPDAPLWRIHHEDRPNCKTNKRAYAIARSLRDEVLRQQVEISVECLNFPHLGEYDLVRVKDPTVGSFDLRLNQLTIPLDGSAMTLGSVRRVTGGWWGRVKNHG